MERNLFHDIQLKIFEHEGEPSAPPVSLNLLGRKVWDGAATPPGTRGDVRQFRFDNNQGAPEDAPSSDSGKLPALIPGWRADALDNAPSDWQSLRSAEEEVLWQHALTGLQNDINTLDAKAQTSEADSINRLALEAELGALKTHGFLEAVPGAHLWGSDADGVYRRLSTPNVPFRYRLRRCPSSVDENGKILYTKTLERRPFTLWFYRTKPRPKQVNHYLEIKIGRRLRVLLEGEDRAVLLRVNESRAPDEFAEADARRRELLALRFLSPAQADAIEAERDAITAAMQAAKDAKRKLTNDEKAAIKAHQERIKAIQAGVGLTAAEKDELKGLQRFLFRQVETLDLAETAQSLIGVPFSLTFLDSGVGFVQIVLDIGRNSYTFEDRYTTARRLEQWMWGNPDDRHSKEWSDDERIEIRGSGGALACRFGYVAVNAQDEIVSAPVYLGRAIDTQAGAPVQTMRVLPQGCDVFFLLDSVPERFGWYQAGVRFVTDGKRLPFVFRALIQQLAEPRAIPTKVWDSADHPECSILATPQLDEERKGALWQLEINVKESVNGTVTGLASLNLPNNLRRRSVELSIGSNGISGGSDGADAGTNNGSNESAARRRVLAGGVIVDDNWSGALEITAPQTPEKMHPFGGVRLTLRDKQQRVADSLFLEDLELDGMWIGDAIYAIRRNMGASEGELSKLPRGAASGWKLPSSAPGEKPVMTPSKRAARLDYIAGELVKRFGLGRLYWIDTDGCDRLEFPLTRAAQVVNYLPAHLATDSRRQYFAGDRGIERSRSTDKFFTVIEVFGAVDPDTKRKRAFHYKLKAAVDPAFKDDPRFVGHHIPMEPVTDEAYNEGHHVEAVGRTLIALFCRAPETWEARIPYTDDILPGDVLPFSGAPWRVRSLKASADLTGDELDIDLEVP